jgi:predicted SnoaL-like aldol condensation-catalyzing enzyme
LRRLPPFLQHNLLIPDGFSGLVSFVPALPPPITSDVKRFFRDGDLTWSHTEYNFGGPQVGFDILEFSCGLAVEHWDNLQAPAGTNPSGRTMLDGTVQAGTSDPAVTLASQKTAYKLVSQALVQGNISVLDEVIGDTYIQHNPEMADGKDVSWPGSAPTSALATSSATPRSTPCSARATLC